MWGGGGEGRGESFCAYIGVWVCVCACVCACERERERGGGGGGHVGGRERKMTGGEGEPDGQTPSFSFIPDKPNGAKGANDRSSNCF